MRQRKIYCLKDFSFFLFQLVCNTILSYLKEAFGPALSQEGAQAWQKLLDTLVAVVGMELNKPVTACASCTIS